jgi:hypothetical protein
VRTWYDGRAVRCGLCRCKLIDDLVPEESAPSHEVALRCSQPYGTTTIGTDPGAAGRGLRLIGHYA